MAYGAAIARMTAAKAAVIASAPKIETEGTLAREMVINAKTARRATPFAQTDSHIASTGSLTLHTGPVGTMSLSGRSFRPCGNSPYRNCFASTPRR